MSKHPTPTPQPPLLMGLAAIRKRLHVGHRNTVIVYARRPIDPLPIVMICGRVYAVGVFVDEWWARTFNGGHHRDGTPLERVEGREAIAAAISVGRGVSETLVSRLGHREVDPLPIFHTRRGVCWAYVSGLRDWLDRQTVPFAVFERLRGG